MRFAIAQASFPDPLHFQLKNDAHRMSGDVQGLFQRGNTLPISCIEPLHCSSDISASVPDLVVVRSMVSSCSSTR